MAVKLRVHVEFKANTCHGRVLRVLTKRPRGYGDRERYISDSSILHVVGIACPESQDPG